MKQIIFIFGAAICIFMFFGLSEQKYFKKFQCYKCNTYDGDQCADWFNNKTMVMTSCGVNATGCWKLIQEAEYNGKWNVKYIRQCAHHGEGTQCIDRAGMYRIKVRFCHCDDKEGCNGSSQLTVSKSIMIPLVLFSLFYSWFKMRL